MALGAIIAKRGVRARNGAGIIDGLRCGREEQRHDGHADKANDEDRPESKAPPIMSFAEIIQIALEALGNLFLRASMERHSPGASKAS